MRIGKAPPEALRALQYFDELPPDRRPHILILARDIDRTDRRSVFDVEDPPIAYVRALAEPESEAWIIATLDRARYAAGLASLRLAFDPVGEPHRLRSTSDSAPSDCKKTLAAICNDQIERARDEALAVPFERIAHLEECGIKLFFADVDARLVPMFGPRPV